MLKLPKTKQTNKQPQAVLEGWCITASKVEWLPFLPEGGQESDYSPTQKRVHRPHLRPRARTWDIMIPEQRVVEWWHRVLILEKRLLVEAMHRYAEEAVGWFVIAQSTRPDRFVDGHEPGS